MQKELSEYFIGIDIGGTKCAVVIGDYAALCVAINEV